MWLLIDPIIRFSYNRNIGLALDADLVLMLDAELTGRLSENAELIGPRLMQSTELLKPAFDEQRACRV